EERAQREEEEQREQEERAAREAEEEEQRQKEEEKRAREEEKRAREEAKAQAKADAKRRKAERSRERAGVEAWRGDEDALRDSGERELSAGQVWAKRRPRNLAKQFAVMLLLILVVALAALPFVPLDTGPYERAAQAWLDQPVKIGSVNLTLLPLPRLKFGRVAIGRDPQMKIAEVKASPEIASLLEDRISLRSLELDNATVPREFLPALLQDRGRKPPGVQRITAKGLKIDVPELGLPPLDLDASLAADGALQSVSFSNSEGTLSVKLQPRGGRADIEISSGAFPLPIGAEPGFTEFLGKGTVTRSELALRTAEVRAFGGRLVGNARLRWSNGWSLDGEVSARQMDAGRIAAPVIAGGTFQGKGTYSMRGLLPERMILNTQLEGTFTVEKGSVTNVDMTRLLQGSSTAGGTTFFTEMSGAVSADSNRLLVRQIRLAAGLLGGTGQVEMDPQKNLSGRLQVELRAQSVQARASIAVAGTLMNPQFRRSN
ncbi:MAG TPA: AsmA-like C-terminal region-containing protein, partial [Burkholderiales bacterium]|nr:AsmA-like C-terminal region-containing protein [Burkholderiales bacterium]